MSTLFVALTALTALGANIPQAEADKQNKVFESLWETKFEWQYDKLPEKGGVDEYRVPYSGYIYPDTAGGTASVLRKYDRAYNGGRTLATSWEYRDTSMKEPVPGLFGSSRFGRRLGLSRMRTPDWYGHCNGWTSAAIRHAEPVNAVVRNGVTFDPSDIKALLAEIYIYNDHDVLIGKDGAPVNAGTFHAVITNWLGRGQHPLGLESDPSEEKWNYPMFAYATSNAKHSAREVEVKMNIAYAKDSNGEYDESPRIKRVKYFHYMLNLNDNGQIIGGHFYRDSANIDMVWVPMQPKAAGQPGHESGNPHVNVDTVLAIWRESVPEETRQKWLNVDPTALDRVVIPDLNGETLVNTNNNPADTTEGATETITDSTTETTTESTETVTETPTTEVTEPATVEEAPVETATEETPAEEPTTEDMPTDENPTESPETPAETETEPSDEEWSDFESELD